MDEITPELPSFETHKLIFATVESFDRACSLKPKCVDIGYSEMVICFETLDELNEFRTVLDKEEQ